MTILFLILIILASVLLSAIILVQNPKGGGLSGSIAGFSSQFMGVKQTTDVLEKGTWVIAIIIAVLSLTSTIFISGRASSEPAVPPGPAQTAPAPSGIQQGTDNTVPFNIPDSN